MGKAVFGTGPGIQSHFHRLLRLKFPVVNSPDGAGDYALTAVAAGPIEGSPRRQRGFREYGGEADPGAELRGYQQRAFTDPAQARQARRQLMRKHTS
jgi:hypothetical protein